jgi:glycerol-3-phosphate acyltransferase PlsY
MLAEFVSVLIGYLFGSIPSAFIIAKLRKGIDIRELGGGNMGAANVMREVGKWEGAIVAAVDIGKGASAILVSQAMAVSQPWILAAGFAAILGHSFPIYIGFKGGQGAATIVGVFLIVSPIVTLITCGIIGVALLLTRHVFSSIAIATPFLPLTVWLVKGSPILVLFALTIVFYVGFRSRQGLKQVIVTVSGRRKSLK